MDKNKPPLRKIISSQQQTVAIPEEKLAAKRYISEPTSLDVAPIKHIAINPKSKPRHQAPHRTTSP